MICIGLLPLSPWTGPLGAGDSPFPGRFLKRRAPPRCSGAWDRLMPGNAARKRPPPRRFPAHGRRHPACRHAQAMQPKHRAAHAPTMHSQMDEARHKAGPVACRGMQPIRSPGVCPRQASHGQRERTPRRAVHPAQRGTPRRGRAHPARWTKPGKPGYSARWTKPGTGPGWWRAAGAAGHSRRAWHRSGTREGGLQAARIGITCAPVRSVSR